MKQLLMQVLSVLVLVLGMNAILGRFVFQSAGMMSCQTQPMALGAAICFTLIGIVLTYLCQRR